jgi:hypothetical protein
LLCWGVGPSKSQPEGFGHEILEQLKLPELIENFGCSRKSIAETVDDNLAVEEDKDVDTDLKEDKKKE